MTVPNTAQVPEPTTPVYIGTDGGGPGIQWKKTRSGWRVSESDDQEPESPSRSSVQNVLGKIFINRGFIKTVVLSEQKNPNFRCR